MSTSHSKTIQEAVDKILVKLSYEDRTNIVEVSGDNLFILHYDPGKFIRKKAGLWKDKFRCCWTARGLRKWMWR